MYYARLYRALLRAGLLVNLQYRGEAVVWMLGGVLDPLIYLVVWSTVARTQGGTVGGLAPADFAAYYTLFFVVNELTFSWIMHTFQYRVQYGSLAFELLRPIHPIHADVSHNLGYKGLMFGLVVLPAVGLLVWGFAPNFTITPASAVLALLALVLAFALRFFMEWTLALACFWIVRIEAVNQVYFALVLFLSGRIAPLALFPAAIAGVAQFLPFHLMLGFPVEVALGRIGTDEVIRGYLVQAGWILGVLAVMRVTWRSALRKFTAVGT